MSLSLKTGWLIFIGPPGSLRCQPQCNCLEPPNLLDLEDTDEDVYTELLPLSNPWSSDGEWVRGVPPTGLITDGCSYGCVAAPYPSHCVMVNKYAQVPLWAHQHYGISPLVGLVSPVKHKWWCHWQMRMEMSRSSCYDALFCNGLGYQLPAFLQAQWVGVELGLLTKPTDDPWYDKHDVPCFT